MLKGKIDFLKQEWENANHSVSYDRCCVRGERWTGSLAQRIYQWYESVIMFVESLPRIVECWKYGHDLRDCSSCGPDSGDMDHYCDRCGAYWHVPLY